MRCAFGVQLWGRAANNRLEPLASSVRSCLAFPLPGATSAEAVQALPHTEGASITEVVNRALKMYFDLAKANNAVRHE
jgi:hypothetical protein